jgi:DNA-binding CsgD family transcriptional regulator
MGTLEFALKRWLPASVAAAFFATWWWLAGSIVTDVPLRTDTFVTTPYAALIAAGFALAISIVRVATPTALVLASLLLVAQLLFWPARFSQISWIGYLALPVIAFGAFRWGPPAVRLVALGAACLWSVATAALLTVPALSMSGTWGTINGKPASSPEVLAGLAIWSVIGLLVTGALWYAAWRSRRRGRTAPAESPAAERPRHESVGTLSPREIEIFRLVARGLSNADVARAAHIEESTVKTHLSSILAKLGLTSRVQLVVFAYESGLAGQQAQ